MGPMLSEVFCQRVHLARTAHAATSGRRPPDFPSQNRFEAAPGLELIIWHPIPDHSLTLFIHSG